MLQILVSSDAIQFILDNLFDVLLYLIVVVLNSLLHAVVAIGILEIVNDRDRLIMAFLSLYFVGVNDNLGMEDLLLYALGEVVGNRADKHTLGESANLARRNETVHLGIDRCRDILTIDGDKEAKVVINTVGNIFSGQVVGETAKTLSERFGKVLQKRQSISINRQDVSTSINTQMDSLIPPSKISGLTQGMFVGSVSDNFTERIEQKIFHAEIVVDTDKVKREESHYQPIPIINDFKDADGNDCMKQAIQNNYNQIKEDVKQIVKDELERIAGDENLKHLIQK